MNSQKNRRCLYWILQPFYLIFYLSGILTLAASENNTVIEISDMSRDIIKSEFFRVEHSTEIKIEAMGFRKNDDEDFDACGWILDGNSRRVVWNFEQDDIEIRHKKDMIRIEDKIILPAGYYELYYAVNPIMAKHSQYSNSFINEFWTYLAQPMKNFDKLGIKMTDLSEDGKSIIPTAAQQIPQAVVQMIEVKDNKYLKEGFSISQQMDVQIYALGEGLPSSREMADYAWIVDARSRKRVWEMTLENTEHAGGAEKNRTFNKVITLPAGDYLVYYVSDDSHSYPEWNSFPPSDPRYWGITITGMAIREGVTAIKPFESRAENLPIVAITKMRDDEFENQGFRLRNASQLRIYALGESSSKYKMADYAWIVNAQTREKVWQMEYAATEHAGGGHKNRVFDGNITLPAGDYIVYYITDDSHAYKSWNTGPPFDPDAWGITIWLADENANPDVITKFAGDENPSLLAQIIRVEDDEKIKEKFILNRQSRIKIYALGEGERHKMFDYGWIEDHRGRVVWEMEYDETSPAGGARKNRKVETTISLNAGTFYVIYKTDDSHSYSGWNSDPPDDPAYWGITITLMNNH
ncbi:hypothetical protein JW964_27825 [candidate division KSB1 bacterium]|nr:hypothetical protein [candidate division KSB1 bacterium]